MDDPYEKMKMSDALQEKQYKKGETISQINKKIDFFIIEEGAVGAMRGLKSFTDIREPTIIPVR